MNEARINRFENLINYCEKEEILHLFLGHHLDDNLETFFLRRVAGSNFEGLRSMQKVLYYKNLQILRPLLIFKKKEIVNFNSNYKVKFVLDPSNHNLKYSRVIIRDFISKNNKYKINIEKDFREIVKNYPYYQKMIYQILNKLIIDIDNKFIRIDGKHLFKQDLEMQMKIISIIYGYFRLNKILRYQKILLFIKMMKKNINFKGNLAGIVINKDEYLINFTY